MSTKKLPAGRISLNVEFFASLKTLADKRRKRGASVPTHGEIDRVISFVAACNDQDARGDVRRKLCELFDLPRPAPAEASRSHLEVFAKVFWRHPDFCIELLKKIRALDVGRDAVDNALASTDLDITPDGAIADSFLGLPIAARPSEEAITQRRKRLTKRAAAYSATKGDKKRRKLSGG